MADYHLEPALGLGHVMTAFVGKDNPIELRLKDGESDFDASGARAIRAKLGSVTIDSEYDTHAFDCRDASAGRIDLYIGDIAGLEAKTYNLACEVVFGRDDEERTLYFGTVRIVIRKPEI